MKILKRVVSIVMSGVIAVYLCTDTNLAVDNKMSGFVYPINPGTIEWEQLNHGERVIASQIPEELLYKMDTAELVKVVLQYPCFVDMIFYDSYQLGFETVKENFNGLIELLSREDAGKYLLEVYKNMNVEQMVNVNIEEQSYEDYFELMYIEAILAQPTIYEKMSEDELHELTELTEKNYNIQMASSNNSISLSVSFYYEMLAEQQNVEVYNIPTTITTPNGSEVSVFIPTGTDTTYLKREEIKEVIETNFPGAVVVGDATIKYNCHAYAWTGRKDIWMNDPSKYWLDGSYNLVATNSPTAIGQKAYYDRTNYKHSGVVIRLNGNEIRSKWGDKSLVEHTVANCPYFFIPLSVKFYAK